MNFKAIAIIVVCAVSITAFAENKAPEFVVVSGDDRSVSLSDFKNKVVLCFYETKETENVNRELKARISNMYIGNVDFFNEHISILGVADCSSSNALVKNYGKTD